MQTTPRETKEDYLNFLIQDGRNTPRKKKFTLSHDIRETQYIIDHLTKKLKNNAVAYYLGTQYFDRDLQNLKLNLKVYNQILKTL